MASKWEQNEDIRIFQEYLRIPSVHPNVDYEPCVEFLERQAKLIQLSFNVFYPVENKPVVVLTWTGTHPQEPSIILNSHMDVVPVFAEHWTHPPFGANIDDRGRIIARGTQDMKCVGMQYLSAIKALKNDGIQLKRTIHVTYVPDEEIGGNDGMMKFVKTNEFRTLNVGFSLDEGIASPDQEFSIFYAERSVWRIRVECSGQAGHGSLLLKNTAGEKIRYVIDQFMDYRQNEVLKLENNPELNIGNVTSINLTILKGGVQSNVIPPLLTAVFDVRLAIDVDHSSFEAMINRWCDEAGENIDVFYDTKKPKVAPTVIDDTNPFWVAFRDTIVNDLNLKIKPLIFPGRTDSCFLREVGIPAIGFSPMNNTPVLLHDHDEYISAEIYLKGIEIYKKLLANIANV